jgi:hypothetical protein
VRVELLLLLLLPPQLLLLLLLQALLLFVVRMLLVVKNNLHHRLLLLERLLLLRLLFLGCRTKLLQRVCPKTFLLSDKRVHPTCLTHTYPSDSHQRAAVFVDSPSQILKPELLAGRRVFPARIYYRG